MQHAPLEHDTVATVAVFLTNDLHMDSTILGVLGLVGSIASLMGIGLYAPVVCCCVLRRAMLCCAAGTSSSSVIRRSEGSSR